MKPHKEMCNYYSVEKWRKIYTGKKTDGKPTINYAVFGKHILLWFPEARKM